MQTLGHTHTHTNKSTKNNNKIFGYKRKFATTNLTTNTISAPFSKHNNINNTNGERVKKRETRSQVETVIEMNAKRNCGWIIRK